MLRVLSTLTMTMALVFAGPAPTVHVDQAVPVPEVVDAPVEGPAQVPLPPAPIPAPPPRIDTYYSPYQAVQIAYTDAKALQISQALDTTYVRYLRVPGKNEGERRYLKLVIDFVVNSLNPKRRAIVPTVPLPTILVQL